MIERIKNTFSPDSQPPPAYVCIPHCLFISQAEYGYIIGATSPKVINAQLEVDGEETEMVKKSVDSISEQREAMLQSLSGIHLDGLRASCVMPEMPSSEKI